MEYNKLEEAGVLELNYDGPRADAQLVGTLHLELQAIFDKVAIASLDGRYWWDLEPPPRYWRRYLPYAVPLQPPLVRAEINELRVGSLFEEFTFLVPAFLAQPDVRAVLQNLVASVIFEIARSRIGGVRRKEIPQRPRNRRPVHPTLDIGENIKNMVSALSANGGGNVRLKHRTPQGEVTEVEIVVAREEDEA